MRDSLDLETAGSGNDPAPDVDWRGTFEDAVEAFSDRPLVILAEVPDGSTAPLVELLPPGLEPVLRVAGTPASRGMVGCVANELELDRFEEGVIAIGDAQWVDPTSLGRLQRLIDGRPRRLLMIIAHRPLSGTERWAIGQIEAVAEDRAELVKLSVDHGVPSPLTEPADDRGRDLALAARLVSGSIPVGVVARFLDVPESEALDVAEGLVGIGLLHETRAGFLASPEALGLAAGEARLGHLAGRLAQALEQADGDPAVIGSLWQAAGAPDRAFPRLQEGALAASRRAAIGEAYVLAEGALAAAEGSQIPEGPELGDLHLICGRFLRATGRSVEAAAHLDRAVTLLEGPVRIDALGFAAAVADDRQHPQEAERILALAELEAVRFGEPAKLASLGTFHARALNRIGFAPEADHLLEKSLEQMAGADASPGQRFNGEMNRAWILFDRGQVARAEMEFTHLRDLTDPEDLAGLADKEAWRARALFAAGRLDEALAAVTAARDLADRAGVDAPLFLADLALSEGNLMFGRYEDALEAAERVLDLVERQLPAWENVARAQRSLALLHLGRLEDADDEIEAALAATPPGANGWRWRARCRSIQLEIAAAGERSWPRREAEDLADMLLQSRFYGWAAELMCVIAEKSRDAGLAQEALALALQVGNPMLAARAAAAGKLWRQPVAAPAIRAIKSMEGRVPSEWLDAWRSLPAVGQALAAPEPTDSETGNENEEVLERALRRAGLSGDDVLSPAQRRRRGLVRRRRAWRPITVAAAALGVVALAGLTSYAIAELNEAPPGVTVVREVVTGSPEPTDAEPPTLEETQISIPDGVEFFFGSAPYRGGPHRTGFAEAVGPRSVDGYFWVREMAGPIEATPVAYGRDLLVGSTDGTLYSLDLTTGDVGWTLRTEGRITAPPDLGSVALGEGQQPALVVVAGEDGVVRAREAVPEIGSEQWSRPVGRRITSAPVIAEDMAFVGTSDGIVFALDLASGNELWRFPVDGEDLGPISAPLTYSDGVLYVGTEGGYLHLIEAGSGEERCSFFASAGIVANPIVVDGVLYLPTRGNTIFTLPAGSCEQRPIPDRLPLYGTETAVEVAPAIVGDRMYLPAGQYLYAIDMETNGHAWPASTVDVDSIISASPVVTEDAVYFGTEDGTVHAVDAVTGEELWTWRTGNFVRAAPVVIDGVVYIASGDGKVYAVGES